jgi:outer membrane protein assembly factor BamA
VIEKTRAVAVILLVITVLVASSSAATRIDTTKVREPVVLKRSTAHTILNSPVFIIKLPLKIVKSITKTGLKIGLEKSPAKIFLQKLFGSNRPLHPLISYGSKPGLEGGIGFRFNDVFIDRDQIRAKGWHSTNNYQRYQFRYVNPSLFGHRAGLAIRTGYHKLRRESFYGIGNESRDGDEVSITRESNYLRGELGWNVSSRVYLELSADLQNHNIYDGEETALATDLGQIADTLGLTPDAFRAGRFLSVAGRVRLDWRDHAGQPTRGGTQVVSLGYSDGISRSEGLAYWSIQADLWQYFHLFRKRTLAVRALIQSVDLVDNRDDRGLPFYRQPTLGGQNDLRGYRRNRFAGRSLALAALEYRYPLWRNGDGFIFVDEGRVFDSFESDFTFRHWRYSYGIGVRAWHDGGELFRLTLARSEEEIRFYLNFGQDL